MRQCSAKLLHRAWQHRTSGYRQRLVRSLRWNVLNGKPRLLRSTKDAFTIWTGYSWIRKASESGRLELLRGGVAQDSNRRFGTNRTKSLVSMECLVRLTVALAKSFYLLHIQVVFFRLGKEFKQPLLQYVVRLRCF